MVTMALRSRRGETSLHVLGDAAAVRPAAERVAASRPRGGARVPGRPRRRLQRERPPRGPHRALPRQSSARDARHRGARERRRRRARRIHRGPAQRAPHRADRSEPGPDPPDHSREVHPRSARPSARADHARAVSPAAEVVTELSTGALVWAGFDGAQVPGPLLDAIRAGKIGGLLLFKIHRNIRSKDQVRAMLREAQDAARRGGLPPVPVAVDQEGGSVVRIGYRAVFPSAMAIAATGDPRNAELAARAVALGLLADGITVNHAPVCDVNVEPRNPVIGTRSFSDDPDRVAEFAAAWVRGSESAGVATTPKHFPGHGATSLDSHFTRPDVDADRATLDRRELAPFRAAFTAGAAMVMTAHVRYRVLDASAPATISRPILTDLLRGELGFAGLCVTDSLDMSGIADVPVEDVVVTGVEAGVDAMMVTSGLERQLAAAAWIAERVRPERTREALGRATDFRARFGRAVPDAEFDDRPARDLAMEIAAASITHVGPPLPRLDGAPRVVYFPPTRASPVEELADPAGTFEAALRREMGPEIAFSRDGSLPEGNGTLIVCSTNAYFQPEQAARVRELLARGGVLCALRSPYDAALIPDRPALLSYGDVPASLDALAAVLAGKLRPTGRVPVRLP